MVRNIAVFGYDFPHQKSFDFIKDLYSYGFKNLVVFAAPKKDLPSRYPSGALMRGAEDFLPINTRVLCENLGLKFFSIEHNNFEEIKSHVLSYGIEMAIIAGARIIPPDVISIFSQGIVNFHPGKIPETSGLDAIPYTLKGGVPAGVTTHFIDHRVDAGRFVRFNRLIVQEEDTINSIQDRVYKLQRKALRDFCEDYKQLKISSVPIDRPKKNPPMSESDRQKAYSMFQRWKVKQLMSQELEDFFDDCEKGNIEAVVEKVNYSPNLLFSVNDKGWTPLIVACYNQNKSLVEFFLKNGADPNRGGANGTTPLMYAKTKIIEKGGSDYSLMKLLIDNGADINRTDCYGRDIFYYIDKHPDNSLSEFLEKIRST